jgi:hypothetical protein
MKGVIASLIDFLVPPGGPSATSGPNGADDAIEAVTISDCDRHSDACQSGFLLPQIFRFEKFRSPPPRLQQRGSFPCFERP